MRCGKGEGLIQNPHFPTLTSMWHILSSIDCMYLYAGLTSTVWWACLVHEVLRSSTSTSVRHRYACRGEEVRVEGLPGGWGVGNERGLEGQPGGGREGKGEGSEKAWWAESQGCVCGLPVLMGKPRT